MASVAKQIETKLTNGTISNISTKTAAKIAASRSVKGALLEGTVAATVATNGLGYLIPDEKNKSSGTKYLPSPYVIKNGGE
jgi:hypothetical protein